MKKSGFAYFILFFFTTFFDICITFETEKLAFWNKMFYIQKPNLKLNRLKM